MAHLSWVLRDFEPDVAFDHFDALELPDDGSILPRPDELPAVFVGAASAKDVDWPRRHPGTAAVTVLAPVRAEWFERWAGGKIKNRGAEYKQARPLPCPTLPLLCCYPPSPCCYIPLQVKAASTHGISRFPITTGNNVPPSWLI